MTCSQEHEFIAQLGTSQRESSSSHYTTSGKAAIACTQREELL